MVPSGKKYAPQELKAVLDSASSIATISAPLLKKMSCPLQRMCKVTVADEPAIVVREQTPPVQVTLQTGHGQLSFREAFVVLPGADDVDVIGEDVARGASDRCNKFVGGECIDGASGHFPRAELC